MQPYTITAEGKTYERQDPEGRWYRREEVEANIASIAQDVVRSILIDIGFAVRDTGDGCVIIDAMDKELTITQGEESHE